jgi:WhiB family transcriptional regulator, redox-sensing transcriptional regulator
MSDKGRWSRAGMHLRGAHATYASAQAWRSAEAAGLQLPCTAGGAYWTSVDQLERGYAVTLCRSCPIRSECLNAASARSECFGVWSLDLTDPRSGMNVRRKQTKIA